MIIAHIRVAAAVLLLFLLVLSAPGQTGRPRWHLKAADIHVRTSTEGRYVVEAYLDLTPPATAHPQVDPGPFEVWFNGNARQQQLEMETTRLNGKESASRLKSLEEKGTRVNMLVDPQHWTAPWSVHLVVVLRPEAGRLALPVHATEDSVQYSVRLDGGQPVTGDSQQASLVVDEILAAPRQSLLLVGIILTVLLAILVGWMVFKRQ